METIQAILAVCGGISVIGGAVAVIHKWIPYYFSAVRSWLLRIHSLYIQRL